MLRKLGIALFTLSLTVSVHAADAGKQELLEQMIQVTRSDKIVDQMQNQIKVMFARMVKSMNVPQDKQAIVDKYNQKMSDLLAMELSWDKVKDQMLHAYDATFSQDELKQIIAFYKSDVGQKLIQKTPALVEESMRIGQQHVQTIAPQLQKISEDMKAELAASEPKK